MAKDIRLGNRSVNVGDDDLVRVMPEVDVAPTCTREIGLVFDVVPSIRIE